MITDYENKSMKRDKIKIKINAPLKEYHAGHILDVDVDQNGAPVSRYWRDRLKDAEIDGCVEIIQTETKRSKK